MYLFSRLWRHVPLPLAKDMFALLWHADCLALWKDEGQTKPAAGAHLLTVYSARLYYTRFAVGDSLSLLLKLLFCVMIDH